MTLKNIIECAKVIVLIMAFPIIMELVCEILGRTILIVIVCLTLVTWYDIVITKNLFKEYDENVSD